MAATVRNWLRLSPLGAGSFASVFLSLNLADGLLFAVKSVDSSSSIQLLALQNELDILQRLDSPRIVRCFGSDSSAENSFVARNLFLEYMPGGSIADMVKKSGGKLDESRVRCYTCAILEGLQYLHEQGIVHGDIKGQNLLLGDSGVKIADFGSAKRLGVSIDETIKPRPGLWQGTPLWMAPEVVHSMEQGPPSDVWSLGCTIVEMLQGRPPWTTSTNLAAVLLHIGYSREDPPLPSSMSAEARDFLRRCLHRDPGARWTAAQLLQHPFLKMPPEATDGDFPRRYVQFSPRSTLDSWIESDLEDESVTSMFHLSLPRVMKTSSMSLTTLEDGDWMGSKATYRPRMCAVESGQSCMPDPSEWITVLQAEGWSEKRQKPFMEGFRRARGADLVRMKTARELNWDSVAFLTGRTSRAEG